MRKALFFIIFLLFVAVIGGSIYLTDYALSPNPSRGDVEGKFELMRSRFPEVNEWLDSLQQNGLLCDTFVTMPTNERHHAFYVRNPQAHGRTALLVHGWRKSSVAMFPIGRIYHQLMGYNILMPDLHAHGESDGDLIQMGWKDRKDVLQWIDVAEQLFRDSVSLSRMVLHGISMGAATVMFVSGEETPDFVKCFVEDCGYTSVWDEFLYGMEGEFGLPPFPLLHTSSILCQLREGWSYDETNAMQSVSHCQKPMFFIHGSKDNFVPSWMVDSCYNAKPQPKEKWVAPGSGHNRSYLDHRSIYINKVESFVSKYI